MKLTCFQKTDSLYIDLSPKASVDSLEVREGIVIDFDEDGRIVGIDIDQASKKLDLQAVADALIVA
jgi:uncharacterized protein YuzE